MIEKEKENSNINRLRIIEKFEVDYNIILKFYWPEITNRTTETNSTLEKNQMGTRKNKSITNTAIINEFIIETARINHEPLTIQ